MGKQSFLIPVERKSAPVWANLWARVEARHEALGGDMSVGRASGTSTQRGLRNMQCCECTSRQLLPTCLPTLGPRSLA